MILSAVLFVLSNVFYFALHLGNANSFPKPLTAKQEQEYLEKMQEGDAFAREKLIEHNLRLVAHIIKKYYSGDNDQDDLISIGTIGLIKGINNFRADKGTRLATYCARCIENEILMYFRSQRKTSLDTYMNDPIDVDSEGNPLTLNDIIAVNDTIADDLDLKIKSEKLRRFVTEIKDGREKQIIVMRYGLGEREPLTQREVAKKLKISRSYVSRIEKKALSNLKKRFDD
ncbi:MAG: RNA polymerase sporulation sigma factor SigK [Clostridia bacterium]|nr:RNA polymerase sporulation sigma factor SigK [Clostridia bacterium]